MALVPNGHNEVAVPEDPSGEHNGSLRNDEVRTK